MDFDRAQQIVESKGIINVLFNGSPVWIESLDAANNEATVSPLDGSRSHVQVPLVKLVESPSPLQM
ncbi:MAG: H-type small acid-soluble spore protein [Bacillota bacterium]